MDIDDFVHNWRACERGAHNIKKENDEESGAICAIFDIRSFFGNYSSANFPSDEIPVSLFLIQFFMPQKKNPHSFKNGFSLVELIAAIALMAIMAAVLLVNQNKNRMQAEVESSARQIAAQLRALQNEALNGKQIESTPVCDFKFDTANNDTKYTISYNDCSSPAHSAIGTPLEIELNSGKKNVTMGVASILFSAPLGQISASTSQIVITSKNDASKKASVCICNSGNIFDQKGTTACGC